MKKISHIADKKVIIYATKILVLTMMIKNTIKSEITVITLENTEALLIMFVIWDTKHRQTPLVFHNGSKYDYHFIIKALTEEFERQSECLEENTEKCLNF